MWRQQQITLTAKTRGFHLITQEVIAAIDAIHQYRIGLLHIFIQHTSASLSINENADPTVRQDFEAFFNRTVRENEAYYQHIDEGSDDLPAHIKTSLLGNSVTIPISDGQLGLGTWQGIYLGEHRNHGGPRRLLITINGEQ